MMRQEFFVCEKLSGKIATHYVLCMEDRDGNYWACGELEIGDNPDLALAEVQSWAARLNGVGNA